MDKQSTPDLVNQGRNKYYNRIEQSQSRRIWNNLEMSEKIS